MEYEVGHSRKVSAEEPEGIAAQELQSLLLDLLDLLAVIREPSLSLVSR